MKKTLSQSNPHLKAYGERHSQAAKELIRSLASSTAIETGEAIEVIEHRLLAKHTSRSPVTLA